MGAVAKLDVVGELDAAIHAEATDGHSLRRWEPVSVLVVVGGVTKRAAGTCGSIHE